jgi:6-phosphogluconolactonase
MPTIYLGCYGPAILRTTLGDDGSLTQPTPAGQVENASFLAKHPTLPRLYAAVEAGGGAVVALAIDGDESLTTLGEPMETGGGGTCHCAVTPDGSTLLAANYGGGSVAAFPLDAEGRLGDRSFFHQHEGGGPHPNRQNGPHAHCFRTDPTGRFGLSCNLGNDTVYLYRLLGHGKVEQAGTFKLDAGAGPRHLAFSPDGLSLYVLGELDNQLHHFFWVDGSPKFYDKWPTVPDGFDGENTTAEVAVAADGFSVYASNRGHDSIAVFAREDAAGVLAPARHISTGGSGPRHFALSPDGRHLVVANQQDGVVASFDVCSDTGELTRTAADPVKAAGAVCVRFVG